jgi:putative ABC transport system permease protein
MRSSGNLKVAISSVNNAKWRSLLTMMGIIIGIVSVVTIVSIGEGVKQQVLTQINQLGKDLITVRPGRALDGGKAGGISGVGALTNVTTGGILTNADWEKVQKTKGIGYAVPLTIVGNNPQAGQTSYAPGLVIGTTEDFSKLLKEPLAYGAFFSSQDGNQNEAVIGRSVAERLFNREVPLGDSFTFMGESFVVNGIFQSFGGAPLSSDVDFNNAIFIPYQTAQRITSGHTTMYEILAKPSNPDATTASVKTIKDTLIAAHGGQHDFSVLKQSENISAANGVLSLLTQLIGGIAAISLLVGGIGIMDVMLVSVTERMHEIGIRKAIGATNRQILSQFLTEATVLSVGGGIIGVLVSLIVDFLLRLFTDLRPVISWQVVAIAVLVSTVVGIVFGTVPALKAARKDPIEALRTE